MKNFKKRWEITRNWQLIYIALGLMATFFSAYLIARALTKIWIFPEGVYYGATVLMGTLLVGYLLIKCTLWLFLKLYKRWGVTYRWELVAIFLVFAITGSSAGKLSDPIMQFIGLNGVETSGWIYWPVRILLIFPTYQVLLIFFGWIFGQYTFFKTFVKKMVTRIGLSFLFKNTID